jgi:hypothetical protein
MRREAIRPRKGAAWAKRHESLLPTLLAGDDGQDGREAENALS